MTARRRAERRYGAVDDLYLAIGAADPVGALIATMKVAAVLSAIGLVVPADRLAQAGGDVIEALHGHRCGPDCWHNALRKK